MQTLAVLDLAGGRVVSAGGGDRAAYPTMSLPDGVKEPASIATRLLEEPDVNGLYVADLEALSGRPPQPAVAAVARLAEMVWIDGGYRTPEEIASSPGQPVIALEAWPEPASLEDALAVRPAAVFSLDLRGGRVVASSEWPDDPLTVADVAVNAGVRTLLVLDVLSVGSDACATLPLCEQLAAMYPHVVIATGGGLTLNTPAPGVAVRLIGGAIHRRVGLRVDHHS